MWMLVDRKALLIPLLAALVAIPASPLFFDGDVNAYFKTDGPVVDHSHKWRRVGGFYPIYQHHPAWPDLGIPAERQLLPLGILLNVPMYFLLFYAVVLWSRVFLELLHRRRTALQPAA